MDLPCGQRLPAAVRDIGRLLRVPGVPHGLPQFPPHALLCVQRGGPAGKPCGFVQGQCCAALLEIVH